MEKVSSPEPRKESRLTTIIDQLRISKTKDAASQDLCKNGNEKSQASDFNLWQPVNNNVTDKEGRRTSRNRNSPLRSPSRQPSSQQRLDGMPTDASPVVEPAGSGAAGSGSLALLPPQGVKTERPSPEPERGSGSSSPSVSPHSPSPARGFPSLLVPHGFGLRPSTTAPFSPPPSLERFSPAAQLGAAPCAAAPALKQMEMMTRNYSDFMRSLAAKYNNQNAQESFSSTQGNGLVRGFDGSFSYKSGSAFLVRNMDIEGNGGGLTSGLSRKIDNQNSPTSLDNRTGNSVNSSLVSSGLGTCGVADFSSSQTLLNLVRTASAQSASQLENYLKGAVKRSAEGESRLDPLDLSLAHSKRPKLDGSATRDLRDFRDLLQSETDVDSRTSASGGRPAWMTLLDRRLHTVPSSSASRTSPKNVALTDRHHQQRCLSLCTERSCSSHSEASDIARWTVDDVVKFVASIESCNEYAEKFREQSIDGATLPLLTEEHLTLYMGLKLGPALKLRSSLASRIGHCAVCMHCIHCHGEDNAENRRHDSSRSPSVSK